MKPIKIVALITLLVSGLGTCLGQADAEFSLLIEEMLSKTEQSLDEYRTFLEETQDEKLQIVTRINGLENEIVRLKQKETKSTRAATEGEFELKDLQQRIQYLNTQSEYSQGVLSEYLTNFESRIHISEDQRYLEILKEIREDLADTSEDPNAKLPLLFRALETGLDRQEELIGGTRFSGKAITPQGGVKSGEIALLGPVAYFTETGGPIAGPIRFNSGTIEPGISQIPPEMSLTLQGFLKTGSGLVPLDSSLGNALTLKQAKGTITQHVAKGGWVGVAILSLGVLAIIVGLYKAIELRTLKVEEPDEIQDIAESAVSSTENAQEKVKEIKGPTQQILSIGIDFSKTNTDTQMDAMDSVILRYRPRFERFLPILATTAAVAPLMGLLGTVVGMIKTFTLIEVFGTGDAKSLSSGISEALVTTELGLIVAIPALIMHGVFSRIARSRLGLMEQIAADFSRFVFASTTTEQK